MFASVREPLTDYFDNRQVFFVELRIFMPVCLFHGFLKVPQRTFKATPRHVNNPVICENGGQSTVLRAYRPHCDVSRILCVKTAVQHVKYLNVTDLILTFRPVILFRAVQAPEPAGNLNSAGECGRVEILCGLIDTKEQQAIDSVWLGELSYSDVTCDTDQYRRIIEGENIMLALETLEEIEPPACEDPEYPGAESLATFTKMK